VLGFRSALAVLIEIVRACSEEVWNQGMTDAIER
jgi:hypothetical protein